MAKAKVFKRSIIKLDRSFYTNIPMKAIKASKGVFELKLFVDAEKGFTKIIFGDK